MSTQHHDHDHDHPHPGTQPDVELSPYAARYYAIEALLVEKGICTREEVQHNIHQIESRSPADGARIVAKAWVDPQFKARLLADPMTAIQELGYHIPDNVPRLTVLENTVNVQHMVVCTLCSCYPRALLGRPPAWYKSLGYRSRAVIDPRGVLEEFGMELGDNVEVRVHDSTADMRFLVIPRRPAGTEGMNEEELAKLVTRDSMIGVEDALSPQLVS